MQAFLTRTPRKKPECPRPSNLAVISFLITTIYFHIHFEFFFLNKVSKLYKFQDPRNLDPSLTNYCQRALSKMQICLSPLLKILIHLHLEIMKGLCATQRNQKFFLYVPLRDPRLYDICW